MQASALRHGLILLGNSYFPPRGGLTLKLELIPLPSDTRLSATALLRYAATFFAKPAAVNFLFLFLKGSEGYRKLEFMRGVNMYVVDKLRFFTES